MIQVFGTKSCKGTQKVQRFLKERRKEFQFRDLTIKGLAPRELDDLLKTYILTELVDTESKWYSTRGLKYLEVDLRDEILDSPQLLRTPLVREGSMWIVGVDEVAWKKLV